MTALVMVAFAANSVLARLALRTTVIDAASFTAVRIIAGALVLATLASRRHAPTSPGSDERATAALGGSWTSALALVVYAGAFSFAYLSLAAGTGALVLFGAVQITMIGAGVAAGERLRGRQLVGMALALGGLVVLVAPGVEAPPLGAAALMASSGVAWGVYSLRGRGAESPVAASAGNFVRAAPLALGLAAAVAVAGRAPRLDGLGIVYAAVSGAVTSGLGYAVWYAVLPSLRASSAATVQLSVPVLAALGGVAVLAEPITARLAVASAVTLGGIALVLRSR